MAASIVGKISSPVHNQLQVVLAAADDIPAAYFVRAPFANATNPKPLWGGQIKLIKKFKLSRI
jgi:hypothetical protein